MRYDEAIEDLLERVKALEQAEKKENPDPETIAVLTGRVAALEERVPELPEDTHSEEIADAANNHGQKASE